MPTPKTIAGYPAWFFTLASKVVKEEVEFVYEAEGKGKALNLRQSFYSFRRALANEGHPLASQLADYSIILREVQGEFHLVFSRYSGMSAKMIEKLGLRTERVGIHGLTEEDKKRLDKLEQEQDDAAFLAIIDKMGGKPTLLHKALGNDELDSPPPETKTEGSCEHEWGIYNCMKCGKPIAA